MFLEAVDGCSWIKTQKVEDYCEHSYYTFAFLYEHTEVSWEQFYNTYIEMGGDGFYACWKNPYLETSLKSNTKLVAISHILWNTGIVMPIESIAKRLHAHINKPFLLVDAAQSFGQLPVEHAASASDIYAFTGHKWACGPEGLGAVVISRRILEESNPTLIGWKSLKNEQSIYEESYNPFHSDARRFEIATSCIPLLAGLRSSLDLFDKEGSVGQRLEKILKLSEELWVALQRIDGVKLVLNSPPPSGLISFSVSSKFSANKIVQRLGEKKLWIRLLEDPKWLRACVHITTGKNEIKNLSESIYKLTKG